MTTEAPVKPVTNDPYKSANEAEYSPRPRTYFGQIETDVWFCFLQKGQGKVLFDVNQHPQEQRRTAITISILPLPGSPITEPVKREMIAESEEWAKHVKPSLRTLNLDLRGVNKKWAQVQLVPTGRKWTDKDGVEHAATTFAFKAIYQTEDACIDAANQFFYPDRSEAPSNTAPTPGNGGTPPSTSNPERDTAAKFLPALVKAANGDITKLAELIAKAPVVAKHFTIESPEVAALIAPF